MRKKITKSSQIVKKLYDIFDEIVEWELDDENFTFKGASYIYVCEKIEMVKSALEVWKRILKKQQDYITFKKRSKK